MPAANNFLKKNLILCRVRNTSGIENNKNKTNSFTKVNFIPKIFWRNIKKVKNPIPRGKDKPNAEILFIFGATRRVNGKPIPKVIESINKMDKSMVNG